MNCLKCNKKITPSVYMKMYNLAYDLEVYCPICHNTFYSNSHAGILSSKALIEKNDALIPKGEWCAKEVMTVERKNADLLCGESRFSIYITKVCPYWEFVIKQPNLFKEEFIGGRFAPEICTAKCTYINWEDTDGLLWDGFKHCGVNK